MVEQIYKTSARGLANRVFAVNTEKSRGERRLTPASQIWSPIAVTAGYTRPVRPKHTGRVRGEMSQTHLEGVACSSGQGKGAHVLAVVSANVDGCLSLLLT